jgi:hypothetical protein
VYLSENAVVLGDPDYCSHPVIGQGARQSFLRSSVDDALLADQYVGVEAEVVGLRVAQADGSQVQSSQVPGLQIWQP